MAELDSKSVTDLSQRKEHLFVTRGFWRRYARNRRAIVGIVIVISVCSMAIITFLIPLDPWRIGEESFSSPSWEHIMGTDDLGRDIFSRILFGSRTSLFVGIMTALTSTTLGVLVGVITGYRGGLTDSVLTRIAEMILIIPRFLLLLVLVALFGTSIWFVVLALGVLTWPTTCRIVRSHFLSLKEQEFVEALHSVGASDLTIMFGEILPNAFPSIIVNASLQVAYAITAEAGISFLGIGDPSVISWGTMLNDAQNYITHGWWMPLFPGLMIFLTVLGLHSMGEGLNDVLNPKLRER